MTLPRFLILGLAIANFGSFIWAVVRFFGTKGEPGPGLRLIKLTSPPAYAIVLFALSRPKAAEGVGLYVGIAGFAASLALFFAALKANRAQPLTLAYDTDIPEHLNRRGPYARVRHPFYLAYLLAFTSGWIGSGEIVLALVPAFFFALYWDASSREEAKFMQSPLAGEYRAYQAQAGRFWPKFRT
jgi:protein-S-isoprenylcysteine O-methyltransferase Ste14